MFATVAPASLSASEFVELGRCIDELADDNELSLVAVFRLACRGFRLDAKAIAADLGCECPYALIGFVEAERTASLASVSVDAGFDPDALSTLFADFDAFVADRPYLNQ